MYIQQTKTFVKKIGLVQYHTSYHIRVFEQFPFITFSDQKCKCHMMQSLASLKLEYFFLSLVNKLDHEEECCLGVIRAFLHEIYFFLWIRGEVLNCQLVVDSVLYFFFRIVSSSALHSWVPRPKCASAATLRPSSLICFIPYSSTLLLICVLICEWVI